MKLKPIHTRTSRGIGANVGRKIYGLFRIVNPFRFRMALNEKKQNTAFRTMKETKKSWRTNSVSSSIYLHFDGSVRERQYLCLWSAIFCFMPFVCFYCFWLILISGFRFLCAATNISSRFSPAHETSLVRSFRYSKRRFLQRCEEAMVTTSVRSQKENPIRNRSCKGEPARIPSSQNDELLKPKAATKRQTNRYVGFGWA